MGSRFLGLHLLYLCVGISASGEAVTPSRLEGLSEWESSSHVELGRAWGHWLGTVGEPAVALGIMVESTKPRISEGTGWGRGQQSHGLGRCGTEQ